MSLKIGGSKQKQGSNVTNQPYFTNTGYSSTSGSTFNLDPSIRRIQDTALQQYAGQYGDIGAATNKYLTGIGDLRTKYLGNEGALMNARLRPVLENNAAMIGGVQRNIGLRGISGSSFADQALTNARTTAGRNESDARALGTQDMASFEKNLTDSEYNAFNQKAQQLAAVTGMTLDIAKARLAQEMSIFQLGTNQQGSGWGSSLNWEAAKKEGGGMPSFLPGG